MIIFAYSFVLRYLLQFFSIKLSKILTELCPLTSDIEEERKSDLRMNKYQIGHQMSREMRFPTMWYVQPAKAQTSLRIRAD